MSRSCGDNLQMGADMTLNSTLRSTKRRILALAISSLLALALLLHNTSNSPSTLYNITSPAKSSETSSSAEKDEPCDPLPGLAKYLCQQDAHPNPDEPLFVTIADWQYVDAVRVFDATLRQTQPNLKLLTVCMDSECQRALDSFGILAYDGYLELIGSGATKTSVAELKVSACLRGARKS